MEYAPHYRLEYQRQDGDPWKRYTDHHGDEVWYSSSWTIDVCVRTIIHLSQSYLAGDAVMYVNYGVSPGTFFSIDLGTVTL